MMRKPILYGMWKSIKYTAGAAMTYTVPEADEAVETTVAEAMPEESESEKLTQRKLTQRKQ